MKNNEQKSQELPIVKMNEKSYFLDERLRQYRNIEDPNDVISFDKDEVIVISYTRAQALEDGVLVDISRVAKEAGFKCPVAVTAAVYELLHDNYQIGQSFEGRVWDMLMVLRFEIMKQKEKHADIVYFAPLFNAMCHEEPKPYKLWSKCDGGDNGEMVMTVMFVGED